jgi:DNA recombination protein RmuC
MNVAQALIVSIASFLCLALGWLMGSRARAAALAGARGEGRSESAIELVRLQERATFLEQTLEREHEHAAAQLAAQAASATGTTEELQRRVAQLTDLEATLRSQLAQREGELLANREAASRIGAKLEASISQQTECNQRIKSYEALEVSLRGEVSAREGSLAQLREQGAQLRAELESSESALQSLTRARTDWEAERSGFQSRVSELSVSNAELQTQLTAEREQWEEKMAMLLTAREELTNQFKSLSSEILEEKSRRFTEQNATSLGQLLGPVSEQLQAMRSRVDEVYRTEGQERAALGEQLKQLLSLNQTLSADAQNLTRALKGDQRAQGTWGEIVLDTVLEQAGLTEGTHYDRQSTFQDEDQRRSIPDVVLRLPGERHLVVDSKVSLTAYERSAAASSSEERQVHLLQHVASVRGHIRSLSEKNYQQLYELKSLDFVLLFIPLESAFAAAVSQDSLLFREAWDRNVILVGPSTLLFVIRTVAYLWLQESQARNVVEIAKRGAALYDKFCGFVEALEEVGKRIQQSGRAYDTAMRRLSVGDGNLIRQAEMLRDLGVKPSRQLRIELIDRAQSRAQQPLMSELEQSEVVHPDVGDSLPGRAGVCDRVTGFDSNDLQPVGKE